MFTALLLEISDVLHVLLQEVRNALYVCAVTS
jgi:hypothetical protein